MLCTGDEVVSGYRLQEVIGSGAFGVVWKVRGPGGTLAALKFINLRADHGPKELRAIQRIKEIRCAHLVPITAIWLLDQTGHALDDDEATRCLAQQTMSLPAVDGSETAPVTLVVAMPLGDHSLADRLCECRAAGLPGIPPPELLDYIDDVAQGIDYLNAPRHELGNGPVGVQHGDVKPRNIISIGGAAQLCDFGLARALGESATATCMGGTPAYLAPECLHDRRYSHATDQYSLAISYHELRTGRLPFEADSVTSILEVHKNSRLNLDRLPAAERAVIRRATSLKPAERYRTCQEFARALRKACGVGTPPAVAEICGVGVPPAGERQAGPLPARKRQAGRLHHNDGFSAALFQSTLRLPSDSSSRGAKSPDMGSPAAAALLSAARVRRPAGRRAKLAAGFVLLALFGAALPLSAVLRDASHPQPNAAFAETPPDAAAPVVEAPSTNPLWPVTERGPRRPLRRLIKNRRPKASASVAESTVAAGAQGEVVPVAYEPGDQATGAQPPPREAPRAGAAAPPPADRGASEPATAPGTQDDRPSPTPFPGDRIFNDRPPFLAGVSVDHSDFAYREGDRLRIQFMAERDAYLYLIYHQADGGSRLLFPNESQPDNSVPARQPAVVPDPKQPLRFRIGPPFGTEVLQVIAAVERLPLLDALVLDANPPRQQDPNTNPPCQQGRPGRAPAVSQALLDQLQAQLAKDLSGWTEHRVLLRTEAKAPAGPPRKAARVGLFIGIGKYLRPDLCHTHEELTNSARVMHELMLKQGGLDPAKTKLVLNEQATKTNLRQLMTGWLPSVSQPGDVVFIYFAGHAGQYDTRDPSEADGKDENIAPYDFDAGPRSWPSARQIAHSRESSILDDTLARWLQALSGRQIVLIVDSCMSGGLVEGKDVPLPRGESRGEGSKPALGFDLFSDEAARVKDISQLNTIVLTSCASDEQSLFEGTRNKTMWFTYCLTEAITNPKAPHPLSVQDAFHYSRLRMKQLLVEGNAGREQEPTITDNVLLPIIFVP